ncbi:hypothetical protein D9619_013203 [Psilocybe cf. subviscida]|uniref:Uncharacterized protein n=1 Tax=Psilocybe cf. subviscida TaxID=2480587 RepID=A0A8H5EZ16_9AGAR|nr:hypothetical protein D9619_013203 [Psilocybe cf. subviscida]
MRGRNPRHGMSDIVTLQHQNVFKEGLTNVDEIDAKSINGFVAHEIWYPGASIAPAPISFLPSCLFIVPAPSHILHLAPSILLSCFRIGMWGCVRGRSGREPVVWIVQKSRAPETNGQCPVRCWNWSGKRTVLDLALGVPQHRKTRQCDQGGVWIPMTMSLSSARILTLSMLTLLVFLDLPASWEAIQHAKRALRPLHRAGPATVAAGFTEITMHEVLLQPDEVFQTPPPPPSVAGLGGEKLKWQEAKREPWWVANQTARPERVHHLSNADVCASPHAVQLLDYPPSLAADPCAF